MKQIVSLWVFDISAYFHHDFIIVVVFDELVMLHSICGLLLFGSADVDWTLTGELIYIGFKFGPVRTLSGHSA